MAAIEWPGNMTPLNVPHTVIVGCYCFQLTDNIHVSLIFEGQTYTVSKEYVKLILILKK